jgi:hypothetical protein
MVRGNWFREAAEQFEHWTAELTDAEPPASVSVPQAVLLTEALELAALVQATWEPKEGLPGMKELEGSTDFGAQTIADIRELHGCILQTQARLALLRATPTSDPMAASLAQLKELRDALHFIATTGQHPELERQLEKVRDGSRTKRSHDVIALELEQTARLAHSYQAQLSALPGFGPEQIDLTFSMGNELRLAFITGRHGEREVQRLTELRGRFLALLLDRVGTARRAVRWVFRRHPEIAKLAAGDYHRQRRRQRSGATEPPPSGEQPSQG